jgi:hypothetical protein
MEPSPFGDLFGEPQDIFAADVRTLLSASLVASLCTSTLSTEADQQSHVRGAAVQAVWHVVSVTCTPSFDQDACPQAGVPQHTFVLHNSILPADFQLLHADLAT